MPQPLQMLNPELQPPDGQDLFVTAEMQRPGQRPVFSRGEVAKVFFGNSTGWLVKKMIKNDSATVVPVPLSASGHYEFQLPTVEELIHHLFGNGDIDISEFEIAIKLVKLVAMNYHYL